MRLLVEGGASFSYLVLDAKLKERSLDVILRESSLALLHLVTELLLLLFSVLSEVTEGRRLPEVDRVMVLEGMASTVDNANLSSAVVRGTSFRKASSYGTHERERLGMSKLVDSDLSAAAVGLVVVLSSSSKESVAGEVIATKASVLLVGT